MNLDIINKQNEKMFKKNVIDKYNTLEEIKQVPIEIMYLYQNIDSPTLSPEYHLQRKATIYKKEGNLDLAIECLRKSNELMPYAKFIYQEKDYLRLVKYLELAGKTEEAKKEKEKIKNTTIRWPNKISFLAYLKYKLKSYQR